MRDHPSDANPRQPTKAKRSGRPSEPEAPRGRPTQGHVTRIVRGKNHGFIRAANGQVVFFHRADVRGSAFLDLAIGDTVAFEVIDDAISGCRAARVRVKTKGVQQLLETLNGPADRAGQRAGHDSAGAP